MARLKFGYVNCGVDPLSALEYGVLAENRGFDSLWLPDHFVDVNGDRLDPWTVLSAVAVKTKRMTLSSWVTDTQRSHPARTAQVVACLDVISHGRAILGIGAGEAMNIVPFGLPWELPRQRVARLAEAIQVIRALWASSREKPVTFSGQFYQLENAFLSQPPKQKPSPPIYVGALSSKMALQVVGQLGDGWLSWFNTADTFKKRWSIVKEAAESAGRSQRQIEPVSGIMVAFPRNARERKLALLSGKMTLLMEKTVLASLGQTPDLQLQHYQNLLVSKAKVQEIIDAAEAVPDDIVFRTMAIGGRDEVKERTEQLARAGVRHFTIVDLLAPKTVRGTLKTFSKIVNIK